MEKEVEIAKKLKLMKFLYGGIFDKERGDIVLVNPNGAFKLPGGPVYLADVCQFKDERWIPSFLVRTIEASTGIPASLIERRVQPVPAMYNTYDAGFKAEHSAVIIGEIDIGHALNIKADCYGIEKFSELVGTGFIDRQTEILALRMFASRDCPNTYYRKTAGSLLKEKHK